MDKISVIIPTYNRATTIAKSVKSVLDQTHKNLELIIVDDGSTDDTAKVIKQISDPRIKYIKLAKNKGACHARNVGIKKVTGKYIAFQDSDDIFAKNKLATQLENLLKHNADLDFCQITVHTPYLNHVVPNQKQASTLKNHSIIDLLCKGNFISTQSILAKKEVFDTISFNPELPRLQDYDLVLHIAQKYKISFTSKPLVDLYQQEDSISKSLKKLLSASFIIIKTDYNLTPNQSKTLSDSLYQSLIDTFTHETNLIRNQSATAYHELEQKHLSLIDEYNKTTSDFQGILNSKGWQALEKIRKLIKPFRFKK